MSIRDKWNQLSAQDWQQFAAAWIGEIGSEPRDNDFGQKVVLMNFTGSPAQQWQFILAAVKVAQTEEHLGAIAAGPLEHLLSRHGSDYIALIEAEARQSMAFARAVAGVWRNAMTDDVWARVRAIQGAVSE